MHAHTSLFRKRHKASICLISLLFVCVSSSLADTENLDEAMRRKARQSAVTWPVQELENPADYYIWQPETLMYSDVTTGKEVWVLTHAPDRQEIYSREHGSNVWSYDGSRIGFFSINRPTSNPAFPFAHLRWRWLVNTDGSNLRCVEGAGRGSIPFEGFGWGHNDLAYYAFGSGAAEMPDSTVFRFYKNTVDGDNRVTASFLFDTSMDNAKKFLVKEGISSDDSHAVFFVTDVAAATLTGTPNPIPSTKLYFAELGQSPSVTKYWGIARHIGPSTNNWADPYGNHVSSQEVKFHDAWSPGPSGSFVIGQYSGGITVFVNLKRDGSHTDGGPLWEDWDGDSFGAKEEIKVISSGNELPKNPYGQPYFGHPVFDRWGKYAFHGTYTDNPKPGSRITDLATNSMLPNYPLSFGSYDGQHHTWTGWTDYVAAVNPGPPHFLLTNKYTGDYTVQEKIADTHLLYIDMYNAYPRPSQSPDGTKVAFASTFLQNGGDDFPFIQWAVAYYPYPPQITGVSKQNGKVHLAWDFRHTTATPRTYTARGWPVEGQDPPPSPREIKGFRVWVSSDGVEFTPLSGLVPYNNRGGKWTETSWSSDIFQTPDTTRYYGVTSVEHSGLESRSISNVWKAVTDGSGNFKEPPVESRPYPAAPGGVSEFEDHSPPAPELTEVTRVLPTKYRLTWTEPPPIYDTVRYYNIYYSTGQTPEPIQQNRIASVPRGTTSFIDWNADGAQDGFYRITSVDTQGNEGTNIAPPPPSSVEGVFLP